MLKHSGRQRKKQRIFIRLPLSIAATLRDTSHGQKLTPGSGDAPLGTGNCLLAPEPMTRYNAGLHHPRKEIPMFRDEKEAINILRAKLSELRRFL